VFTAFVSHLSWIVTYADVFILYAATCGVCALLMFGWAYEHGAHRKVRAIAYVLFLGGPCTMAFSFLHTYAKHRHGYFGDYVTFVLGFIWMVFGTMEAGYLHKVADAIEDHFKEKYGE
jgi:MFS family permease